MQMIVWCAFLSGQALSLERLMFISIHSPDQSCTLHHPQVPNARAPLTENPKAPNKTLCTRSLIEVHQALIRLILILPALRIFMLVYTVNDYQSY